MHGKYSIGVTVLLLCSVWLACDKEPLHIGPPGFEGEVAAVVNGAQEVFVAKMTPLWAEIPRHIEDQLYSISFGEASFSLIPNRYLISQLRRSDLEAYNKIPLHNADKVSVYTDTLPMVHYSIMHGYDVYLASYFTDTTAENFMVVHDITETELHFSFRITLGPPTVYSYGSSGSNTHNYPERVELRFGEGRVPLPEGW